jgi:hypothetical protein
MADTHFIFISEDEEDEERENLKIREEAYWLDEDD